MPIRIDSDLPAKAILEEENVFVMDNESLFISLLLILFLSLLLTLGFLSFC